MLIYCSVLENQLFCSVFFSGLAERIGRDVSYVARILRLATLSPTIVRAVIAGELSPMLTLTKLCKMVQGTWEEQEKMILGK